MILKQAVEAAANHFLADKEMPEGAKIESIRLACTLRKDTRIIFARFQINYEINGSLKQSNNFPYILDVFVSEGQIIAQGGKMTPYVVTVTVYFPGKTRRSSGSWAYAINALDDLEAARMALDMARTEILSMPRKYRDSMCVVRPGNIVRRATR